MELFGLDLSELAGTAKVWAITTGLRLLVIVIITLIAIRLSRFASNRIIGAVTSAQGDVEGRKRADTLGAVVRNVLAIAIWGAAAMMMVSELGINIGPILAGAGIVGLAVGFGSQQLVQDVISGFFILLDDQVRVGDVVELGGKAGLVENVTLRLTQLRDLSGNVHYIRNGQINVITNMTKEYSYYLFDIGVAYRENVEEVLEVIKQVGAELQDEDEFKDKILEPIEIFGLDQFGDSAIIIKARIKTRPIQQWTVGRAYNLRLKKAFDARSIEIPFPHMTVYMGTDKAGQAPPMNLRLDQNDRERTAGQ